MQTGLNKPMELAKWQQEVRLLIKQLAEVDLGYPLGDNHLGSPADSEDLREFRTKFRTRSTLQMAQFFEQMDGASFPNFHNGYFIHPIKTVLACQTNGEPVKISGPLSASVLTFGCDGGGCRLVARVDDSNDVLYLPTGPVHEGVFQGANVLPRLIASDFASFLWRLHEDLRAFIQADYTRQFIA